jgi:hypothetical protein
MAFSIHINKLSDNGKFVFYEYGSTGEKFGKVKIDKSNGDVHILQRAADDKSGNQATRVSWALVKHWVKQEYPDKTSWQS